MKKLNFYFILNKVLKIFSYFFIVLFIKNLYNLIFGSPILFDSIDDINHIYEETHEIPKEKNDNFKDMPIYYIKNETFINKTKR